MDLCFMEHVFSDLYLQLIWTIIHQLPVKELCVESHVHAVRNLVSLTAIKLIVEFFFLNRSEYWKSQPKHFCKFCSCWIADNKPVCFSCLFYGNKTKNRQNRSTFPNPLTATYFLMKRFACNVACSLALKCSKFKINHNLSVIPGKYR